MRIGIDLGGTKIEGIVLDAQGQELIRQRVLTPRGDYVAILQAINTLVQSLEQQMSVTATIGIGTPGSLSPETGVMRNANTVELNGQPLLNDLQNTLGREVRIANDANCFALSESIDGAAAGASIVFGVIVGTGTGAGVVINQQVLQGCNSIAGEWGHNPLPWPAEDELPGPACYCGRYGCIETFLSGPGMTADYAAICGTELAPPEIVAQALQGEQKAATVLRRYEVRMARALAHVINILDPDVIVLGGGMSNIRSLYQTVPVLWQDYIFSDVVSTRLLAPRYGDSSGVRGAAWLW